MNMKQSLDKLERVPLREAWKHEADDFTSWVAHATTGNDGLGTKTYCQSLLTQTTDCYRASPLARLTSRTTEK